ncbi:hypothetical protein MBM_06887 [Drepanopeziza brunnea f. sp. 'multigermtubi' MB_m1]|uniref:Uncharacterized protein n=1 Tax=Marssonina brunnea f. sp. multigermtubi (strain MB_m1) TaxID=1072389 RepID=K1WQ75_MARBU|nr:uncharacterized protein MBM_06887 [Drepanopeziza brunnea f. sp. 'multigermtubi' MB_m1]EKD15126.1 hypothetical protein MBM_06887 [Drepanopeziza brunnea f. sp. 'multigermtubi' MB_m1]
MLFKQVTQSNRIVKRGRGRLRNPFFALAIAAVAAAAAAAAILRTLTFEDSPFLLDFFIKRLLMLTTVKALRCIKCINTLYAVSSMLKVAIAIVPLLLPLLTPLSITSLRDAVRQQLALNAAFSRGAVNSASGLASKSRGFKNSLDSFASFAFAFKTFNLNIAFIRLNSLMVANRSPVTRSASSILPFPFALALAAFVALVALAALVVLIIVAFFALIIALAAFAAALAVVITLAERRAKVKRLLRALVDLLL